ncbi:MAG: Yip1 family protein [Candidatus Hermodarchaeota archaeon]
MSEVDATPSERRGLFRLLWGMIVRPRSTLEYLNEHGGRTWWVPAILAVLLLLLSVVVAAPIATRQTREAVRASQEQLRERLGTEMSAEQQEQMEQSMSVAASPLITVAFPAVTGVIGRVVGWLVWAGALYLAGMALGGRSTFGQMFRTVVWTWLPYVLRTLIQSIYILASGQLIANPGLSGLVGETRPIAEMVTAPPDLGQLFLKALLSRVDLFLVWNLVLVVIGVAVVTHLPRRKAILATLGVWLLLTALSSLPVLVGGLFARQVGMGFG